MLSNIIIISLILTTGSARPGHTTAGTHFVIAVNNYLDNTCFIYFDTAEEYVVINVTEPVNSESNKDTMRTYSLAENGLIKHAIQQKSQLPSLGIFKSIFITSTGPIRTFVWTSLKPDTESGMAGLRIMPKESCHTSYYVTTPRVTAIISILSFDDPVTTCHIAMESEGSRIKSEEMETITLPRHSVRALRTQTNTRITSDKPIQVLTERRQILGQRKKVHGVCIGNVIPNVSWGKEYVVPAFHPMDTDKDFYFITELFPLSVTVYEGDAIAKNIHIHQGQRYAIGERNKMIVFKSNVPFGLEMVFPSPIFEIMHTLCPCPLTLIPVEQWQHGVDFKYPTISKDVRGKFYIIARKIEKSEISITGGDSSDISWADENRITFGNVSYVFGSGNLKSGIERVVAKNSVGTLLVYVQSFRLRNVKSMYTFAVDHYQGIIYHKDCVKTKNGQAVPSDGVDNDCDGFIDEEVENGRDDDGDGSIDEDFVEEDRDGEWSSWTRGVSVMCWGIPQLVRTRSCQGRSRLGKHCNGKPVECSPGKCPLVCNNGQTSGDLCFSGLKCDKCRLEFLTCDKCLDGYAPSRHCTTPCPTGWSGPGCVVPDFQVIEFVMRDDDISADADEGARTLSIEKTPYMYLAGVVVATVVVSVFLVYGIINTYKNLSDDANDKDDRDDCNADGTADAAMKDGWEESDSLDFEDIGRYRIPDDVLDIFGDCQSNSSYGVSGLVTRWMDKANGWGPPK